MAKNNDGWAALRRRRRIRGAAGPSAIAQGVNAIVPVDDRVCFWSAADQVYSDAAGTTPIADEGSVRSWIDLWAGVNAAQTGDVGLAPTYDAEHASHNGLPAIDADGSQFLTASVAGLLSNLTDFVLYIVLNNAAAGGSATNRFIYAEADVASNAARLQLLQRTSDYRMRCEFDPDAGGAALADVSVNTATGAHLLKLAHPAANNTYVSIDGTDGTPDATSIGALTLTNIAIFGRGSGAPVTGTWIGSAAAIIGVSSQDDNDELEAYLATTYNIPLA